MNISTDETSASGYLADGFEGINQHFTDIEVIGNTEHYILAKSKRFGRWWLLKAIKAEEANQTIYQQLLRKEFEVLMRMQFPYIVQTNGMEWVEGLGMCIVMEYVDGMQLGEWLSKQPNKQNRLRIAEELLKAVEYVHSTGTVHRDLKPSNIMVTRNGENIKLIDFELADNDHMAILKQPAGTPKYMSPEQASHNIPDIRNDIYSLGIILQQILPEHRYKGIKNKCFLPIHARYQNVSQILQDIHLKKKSRLKTVGIALIFIALLFGTAIQTWRIQRMESKRIRIERTIKEGMAKIDLAYELAGVDEKLDTCTHYKYIEKDIQNHLFDGSNAINAYLDSIRPTFTEIELFEITNALTIHNGNRSMRWTKKLGELVTKEHKGL